MSRKIFLFIFIFLCTVCPGASRSDTLPPYYNEIMKIMGPLQYSGLPAMLKPQVSLSVDFNKHIWTLHNIHEYDSHGGILLAQGRYGLCAELATYLFERIRPLINGRYEVKFGMVTESGFFSDSRSNHIVLILADKTNGQVYLIDPSFHKYGKIKDMTEYKLINVQDSLSFVRDQSHDVFFSVNQAIPLYIKNDILLTFSVTAVDGKFDKDNFIFVISATRRYKFSAKDIVLIGRHKKEFEDYGDRALINQLLSEAEVNALYGKLKTWIEKI